MVMELAFKSTKVLKFVMVMVVVIFIIVMVIKFVIITAILMVFPLLLMEFLFLLMEIIINYFVCLIVNLQLNLSLIKHIQPFSLQFYYKKHLSIIII